VLLNDGIPLYYQIREIIKGKIESGKWAVGDQIPNEMELVDEYKVSRATVRQAILDLVREGLLIRRKGKGTFVLQSKIVKNSAINFCYPEEFGNKHVLVSMRVIASPTGVAKYLGLSPRQKVYEIVRVRYFNFDEKPVALSTAYLQINLFPNLLDKKFEGRLADFLAEHYGITISKFISYMEPVLLDTNEAEILKVEQIQPALKLTRIGLNSQGAPIFLNVSIFRGDRCKFLFQS